MQQAKIDKSLDESTPWFLQKDIQGEIRLLIAIFHPEKYKELQELQRQDTIRWFSS